MGQVLPIGSAEGRTLGPDGTFAIAVFGLIIQKADLALASGCCRHVHHVKPCRPSPARVGHSVLEAQKMRVGMRVVGMRERCGMVSL